MIGEIITPQEMRARLARSYIESYRRAGIKATEAELEALAVADCELVDAARRNGELSRGPTSVAAPSGPRKVAAPIVRALAETGTRMDPGGQRDRTRILHGNPSKVTEQWGYACARIARITEGAAKAATLSGAVATAEYPTLAKEYAELWAYYMTRGKPAPATGIDHNPFRGRSDRDASRMFMRRVFDICDRSTGVLGHWWVK